MSTRDDGRKDILDVLRAVEEGQKGVKPYNFEFSLKAELLKGILQMIAFSVFWITILLTLRALLVWLDSLT